MLGTVVEVWLLLQRLLRALEAPGAELAFWELLRQSLELAALYAFGRIINSVSGAFSGALRFEGVGLDEVVVFDRFPIARQLVMDDLQVGQPGALLLHHLLEQVVELPFHRLVLFVLLSQGADLAI